MIDKNKKRVLKIKTLLNIVERKNYWVKVNLLNAVTLRPLLALFK